MSVFREKVLLITGGTGSFGNAVLRRFLDSDIREIRIFSRDEKKQDDMRHRLQNPKVKFYIGNVRKSSRWTSPCAAWTTCSPQRPSNRFPRASSSRWRPRAPTSRARRTCFSRP